LPCHVLSLVLLHEDCGLCCAMSADGRLRARCNPQQHSHNFSSQWCVRQFCRWAWTMA
jgi:hypothetical protein